MNRMAAPVRIVRMRVWIKNISSLQKIQKGAARPRFQFVEKEAGGARARLDVRASAVCTETGVLRNKIYAVADAGAGTTNRAGGGAAAAVQAARQQAP